MRAALPPGFSQDTVDEAGGSLKNTTSLHGRAVKCQGTPNAVLPGQLRRSKPIALTKTQRERDYALNTLVNICLPIHPVKES